MTNPIVVLSETCQKLFGANIVSEVTDKRGPDHEPLITVSITLPGGEVFHGAGSNQRKARRDAAEKALEWLKEDLAH